MVEYRVINLSPGIWFITLENDVISETQWWSLLLTNWALGNCHCQVGLGEWKSIFLSSYITSIPATMTTFYEPIEWWQGWQVKRLADIQRKGHTIYLIIKIHLCWGHYLMIILIGHKYLHIFCSFREDYHIPIPQIYWSSILQSRYFRVSDHLAKPSAIAQESNIITHLEISSIKQSRWLPHAQLGVCPLGRFPSLLSFRDVPECAVTVHVQVVSADYAEWFLNKASIFSFTINWLYGTSHEVVRADWDREDRSGAMGMWTTS